MRSADDELQARLVLLFLDHRCHALQGIEPARRVSGKEARELIDHDEQLLGACSAKEDTDEVGQRAEVRPDTEMRLESSSELVEAGRFRYLACDQDQGWLSVCDGPKEPRLAARGIIRRQASGC